MNDPILQTQLSTLSSILNSLDQARSSLPTLLRSFSHPAASGQERAHAYSSYSSQASNSINQLGAALAAAEQLLEQAEDSELVNGLDGVVLRPRERQDNGWGRLARLMQGQVSDPKGKGKGRDWTNLVLPMGGPDDAGQLAEQLQQWREAHPRLTKLELVEVGSEVELVLQGVMRAVLMLRWTEHASAEGDSVAADGMRRRCQVERVACFGLREDVSEPSRLCLTQCQGRSDDTRLNHIHELTRLALWRHPSSQRPAYLESQHSLHRSLTNKAMGIIEICRQRPQYDISSNLEEVLVSSSAAAIARVPPPLVADPGSCARRRSCRTRRCRSDATCLPEKLHGRR